MRKLSTREIVLVVLLALGGIGYLWYVRSGSSPLDIPKLAAGEGSYSAADAPVVDLARLAGATETYNPGGRDLFKYSKPPVDPDDLARRQALDDARRKASADAEARRLASINNASRNASARSRTSSSALCANGTSNEETSSDLRTPSR